VVDGIGVPGGYAAAVLERFPEVRGETLNGEGELIGEKIPKFLMELAIIFGF
jgi:hypothetical protein